MRAIFLILTLCCLTSAGAAPAYGIIVKYRPMAFGLAPQSASTAGVLRRVDADALLGIQDASSARFQAALAKYRADPTVEYAEPNYLGEFADMPEAAPLPNDPSVANQWWINAVAARTAWPISTGQSVLVAVVDTGVDFSHPDLAANLRLDGFNFGDNNALAQDVNGHGTGVTGLVAASCNNAIGGCGLAYGASILPVKINPSNTNSFESLALANAIDFAVQKGAQVINLSLTVAEQTITVEAAVNRALAAGVIVVAAAGNTSGAVQFPANLPGVIGVAAIDQTGAVANFSNRGAGITIAAPGKDMVSALIGGGFGVIGSGTSFAAPLVTAAVAQIKLLAPTLSRSVISQRLVETGKPVVGTTQFGTLDDGALLQSFLADVVPDSRRYVLGSNKPMSVSYKLPAAGRAMDIYVGAVTPIGEFGLLADGSWYPVEANTYRPIISSYQPSAVLSGTLFGQNGIYPAVPWEALPVGAYRWRVFARAAGSGQTIGPVIDSPFTIAAP